MRTVLSVVFVFVSFSMFAAACDGGTVVAERPDEPAVAESEAPLTGQFCGGIAGFPCPAGYTCVDDPHDDCHPRRGGADCGGVCVRRGKPQCKVRGDKTKTYVGTSPEECAVIRFECEPGTEYFADECGCGCQDAPAPTCDHDADPAKTYVGTSPEECAVIQFLCAAPSEPFADECGCGCVTPPAGAPCGSATCAPDQVCCNASCGICTPPDGVCTQQVCAPEE